MSIKSPYAGREMSTLGNVATYINGRAFKPSEWENSGLPIIRIQNLTNPSASYNYSSRELEEKYKVRKGDLLFAWSASLGAHIWKGNDAWLNQHIFRVVLSEKIEKKYLYYFLLQVVAELYAKTHGSGMVHITKGPFMNTPIPVPSLPEQKRIVSKIEELFSKLDASVTELQTAKEKLKVYRQAVLKEAFDSVQGNSKRVTIKSVCETIKVGIVIKPTQYYVEQGGVFAFRNANVRRNYIEDKDWAMISKEGHQKNLKSQVHKGDVLIARSGVNLGMAAAVPQKYDGYNAIDVVIAVPKKEFILPQYLAQYTNSPYGLEIVRKNQHGAAQGHLNVKEYGNLPIFLPNIPEQYSLLEKIESRLSVCDSIEQTIDTSLQQAKALRQSILKQAFEGRVE